MSAVLDNIRDILDDTTRKMFMAGANAITNIPEDAYEQMSKEDCMALLGLLLLSGFLGKEESE